LLEAPRIVLTNGEKEPIQEVVQTVAR